MLGQLAYRLGGPSGFAKVEEQDRNLRGSSTTQIAELLEANAPCLILLDELLQYLTKALAVPTHDGNLAATTLTFIKELCTAAASVPRRRGRRHAHQLQPGGLCEPRRRGDAGTPVQGGRPDREHRHPG